MSPAAQVLISSAVAIVVAWIAAYGQIRRERAKLSETYKATHFSHRQSWYHRLLNAERKRRAVIFTGEQPGNWAALQREFRESVNGVVISGTREAMEAAKSLEAAYDAKPPDQSTVENALRAFVDAVRDDLAPPDGGAPGSTP